MRNWILIGTAATALAACGGGSSADKRGESDSNVTSEVVSTNDTTAIDAATGEAAAMAADVDFMPELDDSLGDNAQANRSAPPAARAPATKAKPAARQRPAAAKPAESPEPAAPADATDSNGV